MQLSTELCDFLLHEKYPDCVDTKNLKRNFRRKASRYNANKERTLYQVSSVLQDETCISLLFLLHFYIYICLESSGSR